MAKKRYPSRWAIMAASLMFMSFGGTCYSFGLISDTVKSRLDLSQSQVDIVSVMGQIGAGCTIIPGLFNNYYGPHVSVWVGLVVIFIGWGSISLITSQIIDISSLSYSWLIIGLCCWVYNHGLTWLSGIAAPTIAQNFPKCDHGKYLGLAKGYLGLGSAYIATFKSDLANDNVDIFMFSVLAYIPIFILIFGWFLIQLPKYYVYQYKTYENSSNSKIWYFFAILLALYLIGGVIFQDIINLDNLYSIQIAMFIVAQLLWYSPLFLALCNHGPFWLHLDPEKDEKMDDLLIQNDNNENEKENKVTDIGMPDIYFTIDFWLLYLPFIIIAGSGLVLIANVAQIVESALSTKLHDKKSDSITTTLVTIISCGNFFGRIIVGYLSDVYRNKYHRVFWMMFSSFGMCLSTLYIFLISSFFSGSSMTIPLIIGSFIIGCSYGWVFSTVLAAVCDLWGTKYLSGNYAIFDSCGAIGQVLFSNVVFAMIYSHKGKTVEHDGKKCYGNDCFKWTFLICSGCCIVAFLMSLFHFWSITRRKRINN